MDYIKVVYWSTKLQRAMHSMNGNNEPCHAFNIWHESIQYTCISNTGWIIKTYASITLVRCFIALLRNFFIFSSFFSLIMRLARFKLKMVASISVFLVSFRLESNKPTQFN